MASAPSIPKLGVALGQLNPHLHLEVTLEAERLGFESVWLPEHLVFPVDMSGSPFPGADHPPVPPETPVFDAFGALCFLAGRTRRIRLGTHVYLLGLRHPFVSARAVQTLDWVSGGRAEVGVGAGWLEGEFRAAGIDFRSRGRRLDEAIGVCRRLWSEPEVEHRGEFFAFEKVCFEPKPVQEGGPPLHVGGESPAALRRAASLGDGWLGLHHTPETAAPLVERLHGLRGDRPPLVVSVGASDPDPSELRRFAGIGVDRVIVSPWRRSRQAVEGLQRLAERAFG
ncbi:MAG: TIGR03619 family F420-dependent LLM class oxidoreductase [Myxococcota bacterium]